MLPELQADVRLLVAAMGVEEQTGGGNKKARLGKVDDAGLIEFLCARPPRRVRAAKGKWEGRCVPY